jgi:phage terminase large subunit GpA-like protein
MALKRSSKGFGKSVSKPMASAVGHVEARTQQQMVGGQSYEGWLCKNPKCARPIAIAAPPPGTKQSAHESDDRQVALKCPHCGNEDLYRWNQRAEHTFQPPQSG